MGRAESSLGMPVSVTKDNHQILHFKYTLYKYII